LLRDALVDGADAGRDTEQGTPWFQGKALAHPCVVSMPLLTRCRPRV